MPIQTSPLSDHPFGVHVRGVTEQSLSDESLRCDLREMLAESGLIVLQGMEASHALQVSVGEAFGKIKHYPTSQRANSGDVETPGVGEMVSSPGKGAVVEVDGEILAGWMPWHFDQCYEQNPNVARVLRCGRRVESGGETGFLDGAELYRKLDPDLLRQIETSSVEYEMDTAVENLRFGAPAGFRVVRRSGAAAREAQTATHRAVRTNSTGRKVFLVSPWMATGIAGRAEADGVALLEAIGQEILRLGCSLAYSHSWQLSDMVVWDNLRMLHSSSGFDPSQTRTMYRTTIHAD